jgi:hypothetical protein
MSGMFSNQNQNQSVENKSMPYFGEKHQSISDLSLVLKTSVSKLSPRLIGWKVRRDN